MKALPIAFTAIALVHPAGVLAAENAPLKLHIHVDGKIEVQDHELSDEAVFQALSALADKNKTTLIVVCTNEHTPLERVTKVYEMCHKLGLNKIVIQSE